MDVVLGRREILSLLFKHGRLLGALFLGVFVLIFGGSFLLPSKYKAEGRILVQGGPEYEIPTEKGATQPTGVPYVTKQEIINSEVEILGSRDLMESTIRDVGLARLYSGVANSGNSAEEKMNEAVKKFGKSLKVEPVVMSNVITLQYWNTDRAAAIQALDQFAKLYLQRHADIFGDKRSGFLGERAGEYERQLADVTQKITNLKNSEHLSDITYEREQLIQDRADVEAKLRDLKTQSIDAHRALDFYSQRLKSMPELVLTNQNSADAVETAKARLLDLNTQLEQVNLRYANDNPDAFNLRQDLEHQIGQIKAFINDPSINQQNTLGRNVTFDDGRMKLQNAEVAVPAVDQKIAFETYEDNRILNRLNELDNGEASLEIMTREQATLRELVQDYRSRYEEARSGSDLAKRHAVSVSLVDPPEADLKPDKPKHLLYAAVGFVLAFMTTTMALLYLLVFREAIVTTESLERTLNVRVLGAVPDTA